MNDLTFAGLILTCLYLMASSFSRATKSFSKYKAIKMDRLRACGQRTNRLKHKASTVSFDADKKGIQDAYGWFGNRR